MKRRVITFTVLLVMAFFPAMLSAEVKPAHLIPPLSAFLMGSMEGREAGIDEIMKLEPTWEDITNALSEMHENRKGKGLKEHTISIAGSDYTFFYALPKGYTPKKTYPLIVSLTYKDGNPNFAKEMYKNIWEKNTDDYMVLQLPTPGKLFFEGGDYVIEPVIRWAVVNFNVDVEHIHFGGCSNGGIGTFYFAMRRGDIVASACVFPGMIRINGQAPDRTALELTNLYNIPFLIWAGSKDTDWYNAGIKANDLILRAGGHSTFVSGHNENHIPSSKVDVRGTFIDHFRSNKNKRPDKYQWYFHDKRYTMAYNIELTGDQDKLETSVEMQKGKVVLRNITSKARIYLADNYLSDGKIVISTDATEIFNGEPSADVRTRLYALYHGFLGGGYTWCVELK